MGNNVSPKPDVKIGSKGITLTFSKENLMTIPNLLTALRIFLGPIFILILLSGRYILAFLIILIVAVTDFFYGLIEKKYGIQGDFGKILDPLADKIFIFCVVVALLLQFGLPIWFGIIIITRDVFILSAGLLFLVMNKKSDLEPNLLGLMAKFSQLTSLTIYIVASSFGYYDSWIGIILFLTAALTIISGFVYAGKGYEIMQGQ